MYNLVPTAAAALSAHSEYKWMNECPSESVTSSHSVVETVFGKNSLTHARIGKQARVRGDQRTYCAHVRGRYAKVIWFETCCWLCVCVRGLSENLQYTRAQLCADCINYVVCWLMVVHGPKCSVNIAALEVTLEAVMKQLHNVVCVCDSSLWRPQQLLQLLLGHAQSMKDRVHTARWYHYSKKLQWKSQLEAPWFDMLVQITSAYGQQ